MKAIIMAGGEGTRLRPLTCDCPKPMVPVMDKPVMEYALALLRDHGIKDIGVTLAYLPNRVKDYFGDGEEFGVHMQYYVEEEPLGTAGSVKQAQDFLTETFCVLSGDGLTDCDLTKALEFHRRNGAVATMVLKKVEAPLEYGVVVQGPDGRVQSFVEKPGWGEVFSDTVNTGIYILEPEVLKLVPAGKPYDFGRELFPLLVGKGERVFGFQMDGYWCDIGDIAAYMRAHVDAMDGRVKLISSARPSAVVRMPGAVVDRGAVLEGPCFIGAGARIMEGARIGAYSVIGEGSVVQARACIKRAVIWHGSKIGKGAQLRGCVVQNGATVGASCSMFEECIVGDNSSVGDGAVLMPGVKVWPEKQVLDGERVDRNLIWGGKAQMRYEGGRILVQSPVDAVKGAEAFSSALKPDIALIGRDASIEALSHSRAVLAALMAQGVQLIDVGQVTLPQLRYTMRTMGGDGALFVGKDEMLPMGKWGLLLNKSQQRRVHSALMREDHASPFAQGAAAPIQAMRTDLAYMNMLTESVETNALRERMPRVAVYSENPQLLNLAERVMLRCGLRVRAEWEQEMMELDDYEIGIWLSSDGEQVHFSDASGKLSEPERQMLLTWTALQDGARKLIAPFGSTTGIDKLAEHYAVELCRVKSDRADWMACLKGEDESQLMLHFDGLYASLKVMEHLAKSSLSLRGVQRSMPSLHQNSRAVTVELKDKGALLKRISERYPAADMSDGIRFTDERGWAWISPAGDRRECLVLSESFDAEVAKELCDFYSQELEQLLKSSKSDK